MAEIPDSVRKQIIERTLNRATRPPLVEGTFTPEPVVGGTTRQSAAETVEAVQGKSLLEQALENHEKVGKAGTEKIDEARKTIIDKTDPSKVEMILGAILR
jgi:hypothetical protein